MRGPVAYWWRRGLLAAFLLLGALPAVGRDSAPLPPDVSGTWAMVQIMPAIATLPFLGDVGLTVIVAAIVDVAQDGTLLTLQDAYCCSEIQMVPSILQSAIPERFVASLTPDVRHATLECDDGSWSFHQPPVVEVRGARLEDPASDPLPADRFDERVFDQDGDGQPGLTVPVCVAGIVCGETYVVQRLQTELLGWIVDGDTIAGRMTWRSEQNVLAASDLLLTLAYTYTLHPDATRHRFLMVRVDADGGCAAVRGRMSELIAQALAAPLGP